MTTEELSTLAWRVAMGELHPTPQWARQMEAGHTALQAEVDRLRAQVAAVEDLMPYFSTMDYYGDEIVSQLELAGLRKPVTDD